MKRTKQYIVKLIIVIEKNKMNENDFFFSNSKIMKLILF
jgi:hypothetical protein